MRFTEITDDLTGAADSGSYFTARRQQLKICTSGESSLNRSDNDFYLSICVLETWKAKWPAESTVRC